MHSYPSTEQLRVQWSELWGMCPHRRIGRKMLERSIEYKRLEIHGKTIDPYTKKLLNKLVQNYKRNPNYFEEEQTTLKTGMTIIKNWKGQNHTVIVLKNGFEYQNTPYSSLSKIAFVITGTKWNGWRFFSLRKVKVKA